MVARDITQFVIYRWRYILGYGLVGLLLAGLLVFAGLYVPGGISPEEMRAAVKSDGLSLGSLNSLAVTSLPYYALQAGLFHFFGVHEFTIKLPSLIMAFLSAVGLILLLRRWFKSNIAVLASLIAVTTGQFLFVAQNGTNGISYIFWPTMLLLIGTQVTRVKSFKLFWKLLFAAVAALSLYTPLGVYPIIAIGLAVLLHPHLRLMVRRLPKLKVALSLVVAGLFLTPLIMMIVVNPHMGLALLGAPDVWPPDLAVNFMTLLRQFFLFWEPSTTTLMTPVFGLGSSLLILLGFYRLIRTFDTTRSYLVLIWLICLVPVLLINPKFTSVTFVPSVLLLAAGLTSLIGYWYRLFPYNPYARIAGLIPLVILVATLIGTGLDRYFYGYHYDPHTAVNFSKDLKLLPDNTAYLVVTKDELPFYQAVAHHETGLTVLTSAPTATMYAATKAAHQTESGYTINRIITASYTNASDRFYVYKKTDV